MGPSTTTSTPAAGAGGILVSEEYRNLVDKSFSKFSRLREFPLYGRNKWDSYYHKAFQVYSKLWKFQQENREELMRTGLKRWEIGEIASRIGQLYYNYYLRTSDAKFLTESKMFYEAIMTREYFKDTGKDTSLANKHLRFYARFIVVCLLLNKRETVRQLVAQFDRLVQDYAHLFQVLIPLSLQPQTAAFLCRAISRTNVPSRRPSGCRKSPCRIVFRDLITIVLCT